VAPAKSKVLSPRPVLIESGFDFLAPGKAGVKFWINMFLILLDLRGKPQGLFQNSDQKL